MANDLKTMIPQLLAQALLLLRENCTLPRIVNNSYSTEAGMKGSVVEVPIAPKIATRNVVPGAVPPQAQDARPGMVNIPMDQWIEAPFYLTDNDKKQVASGFLPAAAASAVKSLAADINAYLLKVAYQRAFLFAGTAGTTPFATGTAEYSLARKELNKQFCPVDGRYVILNPDAESNALELAAFKEADKRGDQGGIIKGSIGEKMGALWLMDQQVPSHVAGVPGGTPIVAGAQLKGQGSKYDGDAAGVYTDGSGTLNVSGMTITTGTYKAGDVISIAGDATPYVVLDDAAASGTGTATLHIFPAIRANLAGSNAITLKASHVANLVMHKDAVAFASRPLLDTTEGLATVESLVDPKSGLVLRLEISRQYKQTNWSFDVLFGGKNIRPETVARIAG